MINYIMDELVAKNFMATICLPYIVVPSIHSAVLRVCALYTASCSGISPGGLKWFPCVQCLLGEEGRVSTSVDTTL